MANFDYYVEMARKLSPLKATPKVWNYLKYKTLRKQPEMLLSRYTPQIAHYFVTKRCNMDCDYCASGKYMKEGIRGWKESEATLEKTKRIFANPLFANCLLVDLVGGEPMLVEDFDRIVAFLSDRGHMTNVATNGIKLAERIADLKQAGISRINVSYYDQNRPILERNLPVINGIFPVHMSFVMLRSVVEQKPEHILEVARFTKSAGAKSLRLWIYRPMGGNIHRDEIITDTNPAYLDMRQRIDAALPGFCIWPEPIRMTQLQKRCPQVWQRVGCDPTGEMIICCGIDEPLKGENSNLFDAHPDVVYNHPTLVDMRKKLLDPESEPPDACKSCNLLGDPGW
ncbi:MAG: radical SAM protein [Magnetococcales bacterium]|nr:radical SAM protein [Magnetococcales bacterium]NGZ06019.1 radical SAM protein [Magnetococcales bacterium]